MKPLTPFEVLARSRAALVRIVRMAFVVLITVVTLLYMLKIDPQDNTSLQFADLKWWVPLSATFVLATLVLAIDYLTPQKKLSAISGLVLGLISGLLATFAVGFIMDLLVQAWEIKAANLVGTIKVLIGIALCYLAISTILQTQDEFRLVIPYVEFAKQIRGPKPMILDSSTLIDARVVEVAQTGFLQVPVVIPSFIIGELQQLADSSDRIKRAKGRRGLESIQRLQKLRTAGLDISVDETPIPGIAADQMLLELARLMPGTIVTTDSGLCRVAKIQNLESVNMADLAVALKPAVLLGTQMSLHLVRAGEQPGQGVGYLEDGTMVVVDQGAALVGTDVRIEVTGSVQTTAGRLIFAKPLGMEGPAVSAGGLAAQAAPRPAAAQNTGSDALPAAPRSDAPASVGAESQSDHGAVPASAQAAAGEAVSPGTEPAMARAASPVSGQGSVSTNQATNQAMNQAINQAINEPTNEAPNGPMNGPAIGPAGAFRRPLNRPPGRNPRR